MYKYLYTLSSSLANNHSTYRDNLSHSGRHLLLQNRSIPLRQPVEVEEQQQSGVRLHLQVVGAEGHSEEVVEAVVLLREVGDHQ